MIMTTMVVGVTKEMTLLLLMIAVIIILIISILV